MISIAQPTPKNMIPAPSEWVESRVLGLPDQIANKIKREWQKIRVKPYPAEKLILSDLSDPREYDANRFVLGITEKEYPSAISLDADSEAVKDFANQNARHLSVLVGTFGVKSNGVAKSLGKCGLPLPNADTENGILARAVDPQWHVRATRRYLNRTTESLAIDLGMVHKRAAPYASDLAVARRKAQKRANRLALQAVTLINELGEEFKLEELFEKSISNPRIRRAELMTRIHGFEYIAQGLEHAGEFVTITCPSRFHSRMAASGNKNPKWDGSKPVDANSYLGSVWKRITAALARAKIKPYGFRVAEPHHDGTPHYHGLFFMPKDQVPKFRRIVARYAVNADRLELGLRYADTKELAKEQAKELIAAAKLAGKKPKTIEALTEKINYEAAYWDNPPKHVWHSIKARVCFKAIDWSKGSATGYIAKYIAKNIDGQRNDGTSMGEDLETGTCATESAIRVDAWASTWNIRQFQQVGGCPVGVWRELRRLDISTYQDSDISEYTLIQAAIAADTGHWGRFFELMGGHQRARKDQPLGIHKDPAGGMNKYGESNKPVIRGVVERNTGELAISRIHKWTKKSTTGGEAAPWTCVNNSTFSQFPTEVSTDFIRKMDTSDWDSKDWFDSALELSEPEHKPIKTIDPEKALADWEANKDLNIIAELLRGRLNRDPVRGLPQINPKEGSPAINQIKGLGDIIRNIAENKRISEFNKKQAKNERVWLDYQVKAPRISSILKAAEKLTANFFTLDDEV